MISREQSREILASYTEGASLLRHARTVELVMEALGKHLGEDADKFAVTGLLHDADYEKHPEGFIVAAALIRPTKIEGMKIKSVKKKFKNPKFAAKVDREECRKGAEMLGWEIGELMGFIINVLAENKEELLLAADSPPLS